jgi:hypothetical protein
MNDKNKSATAWPMCPPETHPAKVKMPRSTRRFRLYEMHVRRELAKQLEINSSDIIKYLFMNGKVITINQTLDDEAIGTCAFVWL